MPAPSRSSRSRFDQYRTEARARRRRQDVKRQDAVPVARSRSRQRTRSFMQLFRSFLGLLGGHRGVIIACLGTVTVSTLLALVPPYGSKLVIDYVLTDAGETRPLPSWMALPEDKRTLLYTVAGAMVLITLVSISIGLWGRWQATRITKRVQVGVRREVFDHAVQLPLHRIQAMKSGGVASLLREDAGAVGDLIFSMLYNPWRAIVSLAGCLIVLASVDWRMLLGSLAIIPIIFVTHRTWIARIRPMYADVRATRQTIDAHAAESFGGMRVVRAFSRHRSEAGRFVRGNHLMARQELAVWWWARAVDVAWSILIPTASAALLAVGGTLVLNGTITVGDLIMFLFYITLLLGPLGALASSATIFQNALAGLDRILDVLEEPQEMADSRGHIVLRPQEVAGRITLRDVTFTYPGSSEPVIHEVSFDAPPGSMVAFVGPSGAGKTTLCNLIARFYDPDSGVIELDGRPLRDIDLDSYRRLLGVVEQDIFLFDGTIAENIGYGRRGATDEDIAEAARLANAADFIEEFEHGYNTLIGERGVRLSGGQRQRLAIARAILADPRLLVLDEATSSLDTETERLIQASLQVLMQGRTSFVIAHRLSTIVHADLIVVVEDGRIVESGSHAELMERSGRYERMVRLQCAPAPGTESEATAV